MVKLGIMPPKILKIGKKEDIAWAVKYIKNMRDREVVFELASESPLLKSSDNMKLMKRTAEALGKKITVATDDEIGMVLAKKAGVLHGNAEVHMPKGARRGGRVGVVKQQMSDMESATTIKVAPRVEKIRTTILPDIQMPDIQPAEIIAKVNPFNRISTKATKIIVVTSVLLVLAAFLVAVLLPAATITVFARSESITRDFEIAVDKNLAAADHTNLEVPGITVNKETSLTKRFNATGKVSAGEKATGNVVLYNFTPNTLTLRASTTTLVANGKKYFFTQDATGIRSTNSENSPSTGNIAIVAELPGDDYNLPAGTKFEIQNAALGNQNVYAKNSVALAGGTTAADSATSVSQRDFDEAGIVLLNEIVAKTAAELSEEHKGVVRLVDSGITKEILAQTSSVEINEQAETFDVTVIARISGIAIKESDVTDLVVSKINEVLSADKYLPENSKRNFTASFKSLDQATGRGVLAVHFETGVAYKVQSEDLNKLLTGKNESEIKEILLSKPEVDTVDVKFWPEWLTHKAPRLSSKIKINTVIAE
jgi:hypothetical protein